MANAEVEQEYLVKLRYNGQIIPQEDIRHRATSPEEAVANALATKAMLIVNKHLEYTAIVTLPNGDEKIFNGSFYELTGTRQDQ